MIDWKIFLVLTIAILAIPSSLAEQVLWDDDSDIGIYDTWNDVDGLPLTGASCSWQVYNLDGSINQSGIPTELSSGIFNFTVSQLNIGIYPLLINCTKGGYNGTSTKDSIKIVDELAEELKDRLVQLENATSEINSTTKNTQSTVNTINQTATSTQNLAEEINVTTHATYDLLVLDINQTLTKILSTTNISYELLMNISVEMDNVLSNTDNIYDLLVEKWGVENAGEIMDEIEDVRDDIDNLILRFEFLSDADFKSRLISLKTDSTKVLDLLEDSKDFYQKIKFYIIPGIILLIVIILLVYLFKGKDDGKNGYSFQPSGGGIKRR